MKRLLLPLALVTTLILGCKDSSPPASEDTGPERVVAVAVDQGSAGSDGNAHRVLLTRDGKTAAGWSRDPASMRPIERLTQSDKDDALRAAETAMKQAAPGDYAFGSKDGDWIRVVVVTSKRKLVYDEAAKPGAPKPPAELTTIIGTLSPRSR